MNFNKHYNLKDRHAFLGGSNHAWLNYDEEKLAQRYLSYLAVEKGVKLHALAKQLIDLGVKLPRSKTTLSMYVNDAIGFKMDTEVVLYYSDNCFGTCDSILFKNNILRIHDLKTGISPVSMDQLMIYAAIFCLEYNYEPKDISIELRIYQSNEITVHIPDPIDVKNIMDKIILDDKIIDSLKE